MKITRDDSLQGTLKSSHPFQTELFVETEKIFFQSQCSTRQIYLILNWLVLLSLVHSQCPQRIHVNPHKMCILSIISRPCVWWDSPAHLSHPSSLSIPPSLSSSAGQWECCSWFRAYGGLRLEHFVLSLPASHVPPLSKPGQSTVSPGPPHVCSLYFGNPFWFPLTAWTGFLQVGAFSGCCPRPACMNASTYCNKHTDASMQTWCLSLCMNLPFYLNTLKQSFKQRQSWSCPSRGNEVVWTAVWRQGTVCSVLARSVGGILQRGATFMSFWEWVWWAHWLSYATWL